MLKPSCGTRIRRGDSTDVCTAGCLVTYSHQPDKVLLLSVCHGLVSSSATQGDLIFDDATGKALGRLETWAAFTDQIDIDAALVWIDPARIGIDIMGLGVPAGAATRSGIGTELSIFTIGNPRVSTIEARADVTVHVTGAGGWVRDTLYRKQIICREQFSASGDSGAIALNGQGQAVGMVVAVTDPGETWGVERHTIITPIDAITGYLPFGDTLTVLRGLPAKPSVPSLPS